MVNYGPDFTPASLLRLAAIEVSKHMWGEFNTKRNVKEVISSALMSLGTEDIADLDYFCESHHFKEGKDQLLTHMTNQIDKLLLPKPAKDEMMFVAESMGLTMFEWSEIMNKQGNSEIDVEHYLDKIHWTQFGSIDTAETTRILYFSKSINDFVAWLEICTHCLEDCITDYWPTRDCAMMNSILCYASTSMLNFLRFSLPIYWFYRMYNNAEGIILHFKKFEESNHIKLYVDDSSLECNMFMLTFSSRNYSAIKYFWTLLSEDERKKKMIDIPKCGILTHFFEDSRKYHDLIMFLWKQLAIYGQINPLPIILRTQGPREMITDWPWQDIFMTTLERISNDIKYEEYKDTMRCIINVLNDDRRQSVHFKCCQVFLKLWAKSPATVKKETVADEGTCYALVSIGDINLLEEIVNDSALGEMKQKILTTFAEDWEDNLKCFDMQLDEFYKRFCSSQEDKEWLENLITV